MWFQDWGTMIWGGTFVPTVPTMGPIGWAFLIGAMLGAACVAWRSQFLKAKGALALVAIVAVPLTALAALNLPHTFVNGTVADADQVNGNFDAIRTDFAKFQMSVSAATQATFPISAAAISQLCEDLDGCGVIIAVYGPNGPSTAPLVGEVVRLHFNTASGGWTTSSDQQGGTDNDGLAEKVSGGVLGCEVSDGNHTFQDSTPGFNIVVDFGFDAAAICHLTLND